MRRASPGSDSPSVDVVPPFGNAPSATTTIEKCRPAAIARLDLVADLLDVVRDLGNENDVGRAGDARVQRDEPGVAAHHLHHDHAVVTLGGRVQLVDRLERRVDRGVEAERRDRAADVVVDRLRHADDLHSLVAELLRDGQRPVAADRDDRVDSEPRRVFDQLVGAILAHDRAVGLHARVVKRVAAVRRAENRAAQVGDAAHRFRGSAESLRPRPSVRRSRA